MSEVMEGTVNETNLPPEPVDASGGTMARPKPKPKPKGPKYEAPTLGRIIHVRVNALLASKFNCEEGTEATAIVTAVDPEFGEFAAHVFSPTRNPDAGRVLFNIEDDTEWHWPERA